jgi:hypothetical protein
MTKPKIPLKAGNLFILVILLLVNGSAFAQVDTAWVRRYNGPASRQDWTRAIAAIAVDGSGNIYVTGSSYGGSATYDDYATIKYYPNGDTAWIRRYNGPGDSTDWANGIAVDDGSNVYVTGYSYGSGTGSDYATIKYDSSGNELLVRRYNGSGNSYDLAYAIAVDSSNNIYVTGVSDRGFQTYYTTIKYYPDGDTAWVRWYEVPGAASAITVDTYSNVYVTGRSWDSTGTDYDCATIKYFPNGDTAWVRRYNGPGNGSDEGWAIAVDGLGNVYITGESYGSGTDYDYCTIKYYTNGNTAWVKTYNGPGNAQDYARAIVVDGSDNVYVTGSSYGGGSNEDYATIKYYPNGDTAWVRRCVITLVNDEAYDMSVDDSGNVYVTGGAGWIPFIWTYRDYATVKYYPSGDMAWVSTYNGPGNDEDYATSIAVDGSANVYVTGYSMGSGTNYDYATIKYVQREESITVVFPNGGETLYVDARYDITWAWTYVESVKIEYSTNGGSSWIPITGSTRSDGSYSWVVPNTPSENCLVKISDAKDGDPVDTSDGYFSIICEPMIVVKSPNGRECWRVGTTYDIEWDRFCFHDSVLIEYTTNNGGSWDTIVETTTNDGLYPWTTPDAPSDSCLIRISDVVDHIPSDTSDKLFSIVIWVRGDADGDGLINAADVVYLINYLYIGGPVPLPWAAGDVNSDGTINAADVVYLINYLYIHGPPPAC